MIGGSDKKRLPPLARKRYEWALPYCEGLEVMDSGCGYGQGSFIVSKVAKSVVGVEPDLEARRYALFHYHAPNLSFESTHPIHEFDVAISFEVIEHQEDFRKYLLTLCKRLKLNGVLLLSTPNLLFTEQFYKDGRPPNPFHQKEFYPKEIELVLPDAGFKIEHRFSQFGNAQIKWGVKIGKFRDYVPGVVKEIFAPEPLPSNQIAVSDAVQVYQARKS